MMDETFSNCKYLRKSEHTQKLCRAREKEVLHVAGLFWIKKINSSRYHIPLNQTQANQTKPNQSSPAWYVEEWEYPAGVLQGEGVENTGRCYIRHLEKSKYLYFFKVENVFRKQKYDKISDLNIRYMWSFLQCFGSGSGPDSIRSVDPYPDRSRRTKITQKV